MTSNTAILVVDKAVDLIDETGSRIKMREEGDTFHVTEDDIADVISDLTGIPLGKLDLDEKARLKNLEADLAARVKGQPAAIRSVAKSIRRARSGMRDGKRPVASFLFCGSTGVGKTELCKVRFSLRVSLLRIVETEKCISSCIVCFCQ